MLAATVACPGCAGTSDVKQDTQEFLTRVSRTGAALYAAYHAMCDGREETAECVVARSAYSEAAEYINRQLEDAGLKQ